MSQWWQILNRLRRQMFALGLSYAQLLARLVVERWKIVEVWPSFFTRCEQTNRLLVFLFFGRR
jgi:hypothetical protein